MKMNTMNTKKHSFTLILAIGIAWIMTSTALAIPNVIVENEENRTIDRARLDYSFIDYFEANGDSSLTKTMQLFNRSSEEELVFFITYDDDNYIWRIPEDNGNQQDSLIRQGPARDNPSDVLHRFRGPNATNSYWTPIAGNVRNTHDINSFFRMFFASNDNNRISLWDSNNRLFTHPTEVRSWEVPSPVCGALYNEILYITSSDNPRTIYKYDVEGNLIGELQYDADIGAIAIDPISGGIFIRVEGDGNPINVYSYQNGLFNRRVGQIVNWSDFNDGNLDMNSFYYEAGTLWLTNYETGNAYQVLLDTRNWTVTELLQTIPVGLSMPYDGIATDGWCLWAGAFDKNYIEVYEDNFVRKSFVTFSPSYGKIKPNSYIVIDVTVNFYQHYFGEDWLGRFFYMIYSNSITENAIEGSFEMFSESFPILYFYHGDYNVVPNTLYLNDIEPYLLIGEDYSFRFRFDNIGHYYLRIHDVRLSDERYFSLDEEIDVELDRYESFGFNLNFQAPDDQPGTYETELTFVSNSLPNIEHRYKFIAQTNRDRPRLSISTEPISIEMEVNERDDASLFLRNNGDGVLEYWTSLKYAGTDQIRIGQSLLNRIMLPDAEDEHWMPIGWDEANNSMFFSNYNQGLIRSYTFDEQYNNPEPQLQIDVDNPADGGIYRSCLYIGDRNNNSVIRRFDVDGNRLDDIDMGYTVGGIAFDNSRGWGFVRDLSNESMIRVYRMNGLDFDKQIGAITNWEAFNEFAETFSLEWVSKHNNGHLWLTNYTNGKIYQVAIDTENWRAESLTQSINIGLNNPYDAIAHDGQNFWVANENDRNLRIYNDNILENFWAEIVSQSGELAPNDEIEFVINFFSSDLHKEHYTAKLEIYSNDPIQRENIPDAVIDLELNVIDLSISDDAYSPNDFALHSLYPNPFNSSTQIRFDLPTASEVKLSVFDINGRLLTSLLNGNVSSGSHAITWDASGFATGFYFVQLETANGVKFVQKAVMMK